MAQDSQLSLSLQGLNCAGCVGRAQRALAAVPGVVDAQVNLASEAAQVTFDGPANAGAAVEALQTAGYPARTQEAVLSVESMSCASCVGRVDRALADVPGVLSVAVNLASETARVRFVQGQITAAELASVATEAGYAARVQQADEVPDMGTRKAAEAQILARQAVIAGMLALPVFVIEMGGHLVPAIHHWVASNIGQHTSHLMQFVLTTLVLIGPGRQFYAKGIPALLRGAPDMNSLVALGTGAAYLFSVVATFAPDLLPQGTRAVYFEAAAVIVVLILLGRFLEARAKGRTGEAIAKLLKLQVKTAHLVRGDDVFEVLIDQIAVGDVVMVRPGDRLAVDGEVADGSSYVDESMITGEPIPVSKTARDAVTAGTVNGTGGLRVRATRVGGDTTLAQIVRMVEQAQGARLPIQGLVDRVTLWFVPAVMAMAALTVLIWLIFGPEPALGHALVAGVSVLIIACPCAMGLATPTSIMVGTGRAADLGVLFRKGDALQALEGVDVVAFDKTGTLTQGRPDLTDLILAPDVDRAQVLRLVAGAERGSEHPIAQSIVTAAQSEGLTVPHAETFASVTGHGVLARVDGHQVTVGAARLMARDGIDTGALAAVAQDLSRAGKTPLFAAIDGRIAAVLAVSDPLKPSTGPAIRALRDLGLKVAMITGDSQGTADAIAAAAGIDHVVAEVLPGGKVDAIRALASDGQKVAFVGDGINDAPALAQADVGIAVGTGTDVAIEAADVVLMSGDLSSVVDAFHISQATLRNIRQNLFWAFAYNTALIPVAAGALFPAFGLLLSPVLAAGAMALSSVFVLFNALRLRFVRAGNSPVAAPSGLTGQTGQTGAT